MKVMRDSPRSVPFFDYPGLFSERKDEYLEVISTVLSGGRFILQEELEQFEAHLAEYMGLRHAIGVGNGTDAIVIGLHAIGIGSGDEVILPSHTFVATAAAVKQVGATPILVDVGDDHMIDPLCVESAVTERTKAIVPVHLNGRTCDMEALTGIAEAHGLLIMEDAAQGLGSRFRGRMAGTFGAAGSLSFYPAKLLGCFGDGGAVVTNDDLLAERVRQLRDHGRSDDGGVAQWSYNSRLDNLQAAVLDLKLGFFPEAIEKRRNWAALYHSRLSRHEGLLLPPEPVDGDHFDVFQNYELESPQRDELRVHLQDHGIGTIIQWGGSAVHQFPHLGFGSLDLPITERIMENSLLLPMNDSVTEADVSYVCDTIDLFFGS